MVDEEVSFVEVLLGWVFPNIQDSILKLILLLFDGGVDVVDDMVADGEVAIGVVEIGLDDWSE